MITKGDMQRIQHGLYACRYRDRHGYTWYMGGSRGNWHVLAYRIPADKDKSIERHMYGPYGSQEEAIKAIDMLGEWTGQ